MESHEHETAHGEILTRTNGHLAVPKDKHDVGSARRMVRHSPILSASNKYTSRALNSFLATASLTDAGNAECMARMFSDQFQYCNTRKMWLLWVGHRWRPDDDGAVMRAALMVVRKRRRAAEGISDPDRRIRALNWSIGSENVKRIKAMLEMAATLKAFATTLEKFDRDPMLAVTANGTINLRNGKHRRSYPHDHLTMELGARYEPNAACPRWLTFLEEVFAGDHELISYVQRAIGYSLTGDTSEQKIFLCYGSGANGKSVFLELISLLLGSYGATTPFDTFRSSERREATNDLAMLKGKRLVTITEVEENARFAEGRIKTVTGQDDIMCRFLHCEFFTYRPQFKLWIAMNHMPLIRGTDRGIWRRIQLIPFTQSFEGREDRTLRAQLRAELPGILNWALEGLAAWRRQGLGSVLAVDRATEQYRQESDHIGLWLSERTTVDSRGVVSAKQLYISYQQWCEEYGYTALSQTMLVRRVKRIDGVTSEHRRDGAYYTGLHLRD